jgi:hypothetical protein
MAAKKKEPYYKGLNELERPGSDRLQCKNYFCKSMVVIESWGYKQDQIGICNCTCGNCSDGVAATREMKVQGVFWRSGKVNFVSEIKWEDSNPDDLEIEIVEEVIHCPDCVNSTFWEDWRYEHGEIIRDERTRELCVFCRKYECELDFSGLFMENVSFN